MSYFTWRMQQAGLPTGGTPRTLVEWTLEHGSAWQISEAVGISLTGIAVNMQEQGVDYNERQRIIKAVMDSKLFQRARLRCKQLMHEGA